MSKQKGFLGGVYKSSVVNYDCAESINWYPEMDEAGTGKDQEVLMLRTRPGLTLLHQIPRPPCRCLHQTQSGNIYGIFGNGVFQIQTTDGINYTHKLITTLTTTTGRAYIQDGIPNVVNGQLNSARIIKVVVVDGSQTGVCFTDGAAVGQATLMNAGNGFTGSNFVTFQDGFFLFSQPNTPVIQFASDPTNISGTDTIVQNATADVVNRVICDHDIAWVFNSKSCIIYQNTGGVGFFTPNNLFQNIPGSVSEGGAFPHTICQLGGQLLWLQTDKNGCGQVFEAVGYRGARVSTHSEELVINQSGDLTLATAWSYQAEGHSWYCLNIPGMAQTLCYDIITKTWSQRCFFTNGLQSRDLVEYHYNVNLPGIGQIPLCADFQSGNLYKLDDSNLTDNGQPIFRQRTTSHLSSAYKRVTVQKLQVDLETGTGLDGLGYPFVDGTTGSPVTQTATNVELTGSGPTYQFTANDGTIVTPTTSPIISASGPYSNSYTISGSQLTVNAVPLNLPLSQFGIGDDTTVSFNLPTNNGSNITSALVYASDWRGNLLQSTSPRTNLIPYSVDFNKGWVSTGVLASPSPTSQSGSTTSGVTTVNQPSSNVLVGNANDVTGQFGWSKMIYQTAYRPSFGSAQDGVGTYANGSGGGINTGSALQIATSATKPNNYLSGTNASITITGYKGGPLGAGQNPSTPNILYPSAYLFSGFSSGTNLSGTLFVSITSTTTLDHSGVGSGCVGSGEVDVQYKADGMTSWVTIANGVSAGDMSSLIPVSVNLTIMSLPTLQVQIVQTGQWFNRSGQYSSFDNFAASVVSDSFKVYDIAFLTAQQIPLNALDGSSTGTSLVDDSSDGFHNISTTYNSISGNPVTMSVYGIQGDANRNIQLQIGSSPSITASSVFTLGNTLTGAAPGIVSTSYGSAQINNYTQAIPSTGTILVNTLITAFQTGLVAQIAPSVLQTPTNGVALTFNWSFVSGAGATIQSGANTSQILFSVGAATNLILQCLITANGVETIYTQYITVVGATNIVRLSISGTELITGQNTCYIGLINITDPVSYGLRSTYYIPPTPTQTVDTVSFCAAGAQLSAVFGLGPNPTGSLSWPFTYTFAWTVSGTGSPTITSGATSPAVCFTAGSLGSGGQNGTCTISCTFTTIGVGAPPPTTSSATIQILPNIQSYYQGINSGYVGIWGVQMEEGVTTPTSLIETVGVPLTDLYTLNTTTGNIIFGVAPLEDAVLTASFSVTETSLGPVQYFWTGQYLEALPNIIYIGANPKLSLSYSKDGGHSWSSPEDVLIGPRGNYLTQCIWRRLGRSRDWVWRLSCTDPVKCELIGHDIDAKVGMN